MSRDQEEEFLLHIAAGTDPATAMAAVPDEDDQWTTDGTPRQTHQDATLAACGSIYLPKECVPATRIDNRLK